MSPEKVAVIAFTAIALVSSIIGSCHALGDDRIEDIFRCLPEGYYHSIRYANLSQIQSAGKLDELRLLARFDPAVLFPALEKDGRLYFLTIIGKGDDRSICAFSE